MRANEFLSEKIHSGARAPLYHTSPIVKAINIVDDGAIKPIVPFDSPDPRNPNSGKPSVSLTRDPRLNFYSTTSPGERVTFVIDQDALRQIMKLHPITYPGVKRAESEERVYKPVPLSVVTKIVVPGIVVRRSEEIKQILKDRGDWVDDEIWNDDSYGKVEWMLDQIINWAKKQGVKIIVK